MFSTGSGFRVRVSALGVRCSGTVEQDLQRASASANADS